MPQWQVHDVMTTEVVTAPDDASFAQIAAMLANHRISALPIVDRFDAVLGVVSWADLRDKVDIGESGDDVRVGRWRRTPAPLRWPDGAALQVMSAPPLTIAPDASLAAASRAMYHRNVGRLLVVDRDGRLRGIVTRSDLLKVHARLDTVIRDEVMQRVLRRTLMIEPGAVQATVNDGVVALTGHVARRTTALAASGLTEAVAGVAAVVDRLSFDVDDTVTTAGPAEPAPLDDWWIGRQRVQPADPGAAGEDRAGRHEEIATRNGGGTTSQQPTMTPRGKSEQPSPTTDSLDHRLVVHRHLPEIDADVGGFYGDIVDEWGRQSFPASDPPANW